MRASRPLLIVNGDDFDGCECLRVFGNLTYDPPDRGPFPQPGDSYADENCDGVDGVAADALFVWGGNPSPGTGTRTDPYRTLAQALAALAAGADHAGCSVPTGVRVRRRTRCSSRGGRLRCGRSGTGP